MDKKFSRSNWINLLLFGLIGQIAWAVENMYFNLFVFETIEPNLNAITLMVQLSGAAATFVTLIAGTLSDKLGNRRSFISFGYLIWGVTVMLFGFISPELFENAFGMDHSAAIRVALVSVIIGDCVMTLFGSTANDAAFSAWVTDNTEPSYRGQVESVLSILPLAAMLIVAGGFGILVSAIGYKLLFLLLGIVISASGVAGIFLIKDSERLEKNGTLRDMIYGFKPSSIKDNKPFYLTLLIACVYGIACQTFMPYMIIYMKTYLGFTVIEYSVVFGLAIALGAAINIFLGRLSDKMDKVRSMYIATAIFATGLFAMFISRGMGKIGTLITFGISGFVMICGYIYISALSGAIIRDNTPPDKTGKLQGVRMIFFVLIPMLLGPMIGNAINSAAGIPLPNGGADTMTTLFIPAPGIYLSASITALVMFALIPLLEKVTKDKNNS
ncbi:MAG: MFS transporter [Ruminococcaceae bacterium]|nr:MFS transporter [Oscillospiraceae bacterium]